MQKVSPSSVYGTKKQDKNFTYLSCADKDLCTGSKTARRKIRFLMFSWLPLLVPLIPVGFATKPNLNLISRGLRKYNRHLLSLTVRRIRPGNNK